MMRRLLLSDRQYAALRDLNLMLSLDIPRASQPPHIDMVNVGILPPSDTTTQRSPLGVFSGLSHWDIDTCAQEHTWCATLQNVTILPKDGGDDDSGTSPCIDHRQGLPVALVNSSPRPGGGKSRLDIVVSGDDLDLAEAVHAASAQATVTVSGSTNLMWCESGEHSNRSSTVCHRMNASTTGCATGSGSYFTRAPRVIGTDLEGLKTDCAGKLCVLQNVSLNFTGESLSNTNQSLQTFSSCSQNHPQGVRFDHVELDDSRRAAARAVTLTAQCPGSGDGAAMSLDELASACGCTQRMRWHRQDEPGPEQHNRSNFTKR
jgi:hypothetical protein